MFQPRFTAAAGAAMLITLALFQLMTALVTSGSYQTAATSTVIDIGWTEPRAERPVETKPKLQPPPMVTVAPKISVQSEPVSGELFPTGGPTPEIQINTSAALPGLQQPADREPSPIVRINPKYPVNAAREGIEGWVQLRFSVDATGSVTDIEVIAAQPQRVFEQEAIRALKRWKYQPSTLDGAAAARSGLQVQLDFNLDASE
ncbi:TonB family protein [Rheinheimera riviphila]|uniref:Protein TonB n=2 Tax=Rheinheimera riviphila TaxID=1834037 RepID=A0A437R1I1_9GAMM|nr:TonB family protein [Rheinheimera riviphila]